MTNDLSVFLFGCKDTTLHLARFLRGLKVGVNLVTISPESAARNQVAGYQNLKDFPEVFDSIYVAETYSLNDRDVCALKSSQELTLGFCIGWQRLIPEELLKIFQVGVFGMHGSARDLPFGKGRSPMNWALLEGRKFFHTNLFKYEAGVDSGPIVDSNTFSINPTDTAETLHYKNVVSMCKLIGTNLEMLLSNSFNTAPQSPINGESFYPKRAPNDASIDWRDDIHNIEKLIRSASKPFDGAYSFLGQEKITIERASVFYTDIENHPFKGVWFGEVVDVFPNGKFLVRCSGGVLIVHEFRGSAPSVGRCFEILDSPSRRFVRNDYGFFDIPSPKA